MRRLVGAPRLTSVWDTPVDKLGNAVAAFTAKRGRRFTERPSASIPEHDSSACEITSRYKEMRPEGSVPLWADDVDTKLP